MRSRHKLSYIAPALSAPVICLFAACIFCVPGCGGKKPAKAGGSATRTNTADLSIPERPTFSGSNSVLRGEVICKGSGPGKTTQMKIYLPNGEHTDGSLGCVLVAPAGTNLLVGNSIDGEDYHAESMPYAKAGFAVVRYSLDGAVDMDNASDQTIAQGYKKFKSAKAGLANTQQVIAFIKSRMPEVDPKRIYVAGHSSAGTVSLLAAEKIDDVAACIAYAPCSDPEAFHSEILSQPSINFLLPGIRQFDRDHSPIRNVAQLKCPTFLFQALDDGVVEAAETNRFHRKLKQHNENAILKTVPYGNHYDSMIQSGIPAAIEWLKEIDAGLQ